MFMFVLVLCTMYVHVVTVCDVNVRVSDAWSVCFFYVKYNRN